MLKMIELQISLQYIVMIIPKGVLKVVHGEMLPVVEVICLRPICH